MLLGCLVKPTQSRAHFSAPCDVAPKTRSRRGVENKDWGFPSGTLRWNNTGRVCVFVHVWNSMLGVSCLYRDGKLVGFSVSLRGSWRSVLSSSASNSQSSKMIL